MKKHFVILLGLVLLFAFSSVNAQSKIGFSVGPELALPMGSFGDVAGMGFGASVGGEMNLADNINGFVTVGYLTFGEKDVAGVAKWQYSGIPILVGAKYYFGKDGFYGLAETGFHLWTITSTVTLFGASVSGDASSSEFSYGVGAGYEVGSFDFNAKYMGAGSGISYVGVRAAYKFSL